jgi:hypothetical protein
MNEDFEIDQEECDHSDVEDCTCLICGKDLTEDMMCAAYDFCKGYDE